MANSIGSNHRPSSQLAELPDLSSFRVSGMGIVEWWNSGTVEWWNGFFFLLILFACLRTILNAKAEEYNSLHR